MSLKEASIYIACKVRPEGINLLKRTLPSVVEHPTGNITRQETIEAAKRFPALYTKVGVVVDEEVLKQPNLKLVTQHGVGLDTIDLKAATKHGVVVGYTPGILTETCADHAWALMLAGARDIVPSHQAVLENRWLEYQKTRYGTDVYGKTLGIVGFGRIGQAIAKRSIGFDMNVCYFDKNPVSSRIGKQVSLPELLSHSDFVVLACDLNQSTKNLITLKELQKMKKTATLVNISRGKVVNTDDLYKALSQGMIGRAALDVIEPEPFDGKHPLNHLENCTIVPHIASATVECRAAMSLMAAQAAIDFFNGKRIQNCANPEVYDHLKK